MKLLVNACDVCSKFRNQRTKYKYPLHLLQVGNRFDMMAMDIVGGQGTLPVTPRKNRYFLTMIALFTRYCVVFPLPDQVAETVGSAVLDNWIHVFGVPRRILSDR